MFRYNLHSLLPRRGAARRARTRRITEIGFTLVELMLVLLIVGILFELCVTLYRNYMERSDIAKASTDISSLSVQITQYANDHKGLPTRPRTSGVSRDDIVRANNGRFIGLASDCDP